MASTVQHYFENLIFNGQDIKGEPNKNDLTKEQQEVVEECADYIKYIFFEGYPTEMVMNAIENLCPCDYCQEFVCDGCRLKDWG